MCTTCGCSDTATSRVTKLTPGKTQPILGHTHPDHVEQEHAHHQHDSAPDNPASRQAHTVTVKEAILRKNDDLAKENRQWFQEHQILALNLVSAPGSGKTTILEQTIRELRISTPISVIEGDQETLHDAERIQKTGCPVVQINTGAGCHLEADMLARGIHKLNPPARSLLLIENVGNLVCPALFDLGEIARVAILSVTEGEDKPLKYPHMFQSSDVLILNKVDLLPYLSFNTEKCLENTRRVNPNIQIFPVSATTGEGLPQWYDWIHSHMKRVSEENIATP